MAGDWIKMRADLLPSPQFDRLCFELQCGNGDLLTLLYRTAGWFEAHSEYGQMRVDDAMALDAYLKRPGFYERLRACGWLREAGGRARLMTFCAPAATRKSIGKRLRAEVLACGCCAACGSNEQLVIDHLIPVVRGGKTERGNLQALCAPCNRAKGRQTMVEFMAAREVRHGG